MTPQDFAAVVGRFRTEGLADRMAAALEQAHIEAVTVAEHFSGIEPGDAGYSVRVRAADQPTAMRCARDFVADYRGRKLEWDRESSESITHWPSCPECDAPRLARCTICGQLGLGFSPNDPDFNWGLGLDEDAAEEPSGCMCPGDGACSRGEFTDDVQPSVDSACGCEPDEGDIILRCTRCDEPFTPNFADRCPWCAHRFEDGFELEVGEAAFTENPSRVALAFAVLILLCAGFVLYFTYLFR